MATRNRRHRHVVDMLADPDNNVRSNENNARFDSGLSKNWTVAQLRAELSRNDISFNKSDKKLKLLQWFSPVHKATRGAAALIVKQLQLELIRRGALTTGRKQDLIERLESYDRNENFQGAKILLPEPLDPDWPAVGFHQLQDHHRILLPKLTSAHIDGYFKYRLASDSLLNSDIKAVEKGHKMVEGNKVYACSIHINKPNIYLTGIVGAAMKKKLNYNFKLKLDFNTSEIVNSHCECPSGKGPHGTCKHVAAVLIVMEKFINGGPLFISKSCTENLQAFHKPKKFFGGSPMKAETLPGKRKCSLDDPRPPKYRRLTSYADHVRSTVLNYCSKSSKDIAIRYLWEKANIQAAALDHDYLKLPFTEYWVDNALSVTEADIKDIASKTTKQSASKQWYHHRRWRITASRFGEICKMTYRRNKKKLCQSFVAHSNLKSKAVIHGRQYESVAVRKFESQMNIKTKAAGFFISEDYPFLGASPDRLIGDDSIVEVKCPYTGRNSAISPSKMFPYLHKTSNEDGDFKLNPFSSYYSQIQGQLYITKRRYCFFVVYTFEDLFVQKLQIDNDYCNFCLLPKLKLFYEKYLRKYIADHM